MALRVFTAARGGLETVRGTPVTPTRIMYAEEWAHEQGKTIIRSPELRNSYFPVFSASQGPESNTVTASGRLSYDDLIDWANMHIKAVAAGTGAGADKTWTFTPAAAVDDLKSKTLQLGYADTIALAPAVSLPGLLGNELQLTFSKEDDAAVRFRSQLVTASAATQITAFTGSLTDRTVTTASAINTLVYADAATIGTTADANFRTVEWTLNNGLVNLFTLNNSSSATATLRPNHRTWTATLTRYFANDSEWDAYMSAAIRKIRVRTVGPTLGASNYKIDLDLYGVYTARTIVEVDGIKMEQLTLEPVYDTTAATDFGLVVVNATAAIT
jgi:hypothetical protein